MSKRRAPDVIRPGESEEGFTCPICAKEFKGLAAFYRHLKTAHQAGQGERSKFNNRKVELDGIIFDSQREATRYQELLLLERAGEIRSLSAHPVWHFWVRGICVGRYTADFQYQERPEGELIVEDVKGGKVTKTEAYGLRKRLMLACHGIKVKET